MKITSMSKQVILITDRDYFPLLLKMKNRHPEFSFKLMDVKDFIQKCSFSYQSDPVCYLMKEKKIAYSEAKEYLELLQVCDLEQNAKLKALYEELEQGYIQKDNLADYEFSHRELLLLEQQENLSLHSLIHKKGYQFKDICLDDLPIEKLHDLEKEAPAPIYNFKTRFQQYHYLFSQLRKNLLEHPEEKNKVKVLFKNDDLYHPELFSSLYHLPVSMKKNEKLYTAPYVKKKLDDIYQKKNFSFSKEELAVDSLSYLHDIVLKYDLTSLDFDFAYANLLEIIHSTTYKVKYPEGGVVFSDSFAFDPDSKVYVLDFAFDFFYCVKKDNHVLSDQELLQLGVTTSYQETQLDERKKRNYLAYMNIVFLSRVLEHLNDKIFDSQFLEDFHWQEKVKTIKLDRQEGKDGYFTKEGQKMVQSYEIDQKFIYSPVGEINSYDYKYQNIGVNIYKDKKNYSVTDLEKYISCPFQFYLSKILPVKQTDFTSMFLGILMHRVLEDLFRPDFDFEVSFLAGVDLYNENAKKQNVSVTKKEEALISVVHHWFKQFVHSLLKMKEEAILVENENDSERRVNFHIKDDNRTYSFVGYIDKILLTQYSGQKYYTIIDYKSGSESFNYKLIPFAKSIQLPLYYYAIEQMDKKERINLVSDAIFGGFGIQHIYFNTFKKSIAKSEIVSEDILQSNLKAQGVLKRDYNYMISLNHACKCKEDKENQYEDEPTFFDCKGKIEDDIVYVGKENIALEDLIQASAKAAIETIHHIENAEFDIAPTSKELTSKKEKDAVCSFCAYADICYHNIYRDFKNYSQEISTFWKKSCEVEK